MTVATELSRAEFLGAGSAGPFTFNFRFFATNEITITRVAADGAETVLEEGTEYTLTGAGAVNGGAVTLAALLLFGEKLLVTRKVKALQPASIRNLGAFYPEIHEDAFDRLTMMVQDWRRDIDRSIKMPESTEGDFTIPSGPRAGTVVGFDVSGNLTLHVLGADPELPWLDASKFLGADVGAKINAAASLAGSFGGGVILVPASPGLVTTPISITGANISLRAASDAVLLAASADFAGTYFINVENAANFSMTNIELSGSLSTLSPAPVPALDPLPSGIGYGVRLFNSPGAVIDRCSIHNFLISGVGFYSNSHDGLVRDCEITDIFGYVGSSGVIASNSKNTKVVFNRILRCNDPVLGLSAENATHDGNGVYFQEGCDGSIAQLNYIRNCARRAVKIQSSNTKTLANDIDDCAQAGVQVQHVTGIRNNDVSGNTIKKSNYGTYGVVLEELLYNTNVTNNIIDGSFFTGIDVRQGVIGAGILLNTLSNTAGWGIRVENQAATTYPTAHVSVSFNKLTACGNVDNRASIDIRPGVAVLDSIAVVYNAITGNTSNAISYGDNQTNGQLFGNLGAPVVPYGAVTFQQTAIPGGVYISGFSTDNVINAPVGFTGKLLDLQLAGVSKLSVDYVGGLTATSVYTTGLRTVGDNTVLALQANRNYSTGAVGISLLSGVTASHTTGVFRGVDLAFTYNQASGTAANTDFRINRTETAVGSGKQRFVSFGTGGGSFVEKFGVNNKGYVCENVGGAVASADTIVPTGPIFHITGTTAVNTITLPETGFIGKITVILDAAVPFGTSGNIATGFVGAAGFAYTFTFDGVKWYPSH